MARSRRPKPGCARCSPVTPRSDSSNLARAHRHLAAGEGWFARPPTSSPPSSPARSARPTRRVRRYRTPTGSAHHRRICWPRVCVTHCCTSRQRISMLLRLARGQWTGVETVDEPGCICSQIVEVVGAAVSEEKLGQVVLGKDGEPFHEVLEDLSELDGVNRVEHHVG